MPLSPKHSDRQFPWLGVGMVAIFLFSVAMRFWELSRFNTLVFDEIYYTNFARGFLNGVQEFGGHPPLSTYLIAAAIWLAKLTPLGNEGLKNGLTGMMLTTFSYRWLNALTGSFFPMIVGAIAYQLTHRRCYAFIAGLFAAVDGLFLVESRYALNNIYLVSFGLLGHLFLLLALNKKVLHRNLLLSGICFGASIAIKWNGMGFLLGAYLVWIAGWMIFLLSKLKIGLVQEQTNGSTSPLTNLTRFNLGHILLYFAGVPAITYYLSWLPYMQLDPSTSFWQWQDKVLDYHHRVGGMDAHPYCSPWFSWLFMWRPVAYFYKATHGVHEPIPIDGPPLPTDAAVTIYDVHAIGNPFLWWFSSAAILLLLGMLVYRFRTAPTLNPYTWTALYLVLNWAANWLPWIRVTRCTFMYHYMGSAVFAVLAIAFLVERWLFNPQHWQRITGLTVILVILLAFVFWLPLYLGLPLTEEAFHLRQWFRSWI
jgi:dolichyl-phosphate-mannose-protein mannosyltransferase